jgi:hypothetical protein
MIRCVPAFVVCAVLLSTPHIQAGSSKRPDAALIRTARSGAWSAAETWVGGKIPHSGDRVQICPNHRVIYDLSDSAPIRSIHVAGTLAFATDRDTCLEVGLIKVQAGDDASENGFDCDAHQPATTPGAPKPALQVGSPTHPVDEAHSARIRLRYFDGMDKQSCPAIVCCGGRMDLHGAPMGRTWVKLGANTAIGDRTVTLGEPVNGWRVGDRVIVTATERDRGQRDVMADTPSASPDEPLTEERTIVAISRTTVTVDRPLAHHHLGSGSYRGELANLSRNVVIESADPDGVRGHTMYHRGSAGSISYSEFRHLGKRDVLGRYSMHFHLVGDTMRGSSVVGASIWDSHNRWITIHGTDYLVVRDCVGYKSVGHGFYLEDGTETRNVLARNLAVRATAGAPLPDQALPFDRNEGAGFWWANCLNTFASNVACDCGRYGFRFEASPASGFNLRLPVRQPDGTTKKVDIRTLPFIRFEDNEAHGAAYGLNLGQESIDRPGNSDRHSGVGPDEHHPFVIRNTKVWNARWGIRAESPSLLIDGLDIHACVYGFYRAKFKRHAYDRVVLSAVGLTEAFSKGDVPTGVTFPKAGNYQFDRVGAVFSETEKKRFTKLLDSAAVELAPADAERFVRGSYRTGGRIDGRPLPRIFEDPALADGSGINCGPLSSAAFPGPLEPVDDLPPATVITFVQTMADGRVLVRGTTTDNGKVKAVRINGQPPKQTAENYTQWEIVLEKASRIVAVAEDCAGNIERTPHQVSAIADES